MEKKPESRDIAALRQMAPHKDALYSSTMNGIGNAVMLATPVFVILDKGEKFIKDTIKMPALSEHKGKITTAIGAVFGLAGLAQGLGDASRLKKYREARLDYSTRLEDRLKVLEETAAAKGWTDKVADAPAKEQSPTR